MTPRSPMAMNSATCSACRAMARLPYGAFEITADPVEYGKTGSIHYLTGDEWRDPLHQRGPSATQDDDDADCSDEAMTRNLESVSTDSRRAGKHAWDIKCPQGGNHAR